MKFFFKSKEKILYFFDGASCYDSW